MITFVGGGGGPNSRRGGGGGPNPLANMDSRGSIFASGFGPGGPNPLGHRQITYMSAPRTICFVQFLEGSCRVGLCKILTGWRMADGGWKNADDKMRMVKC